MHPEVVEAFNERWIPEPMSGCWLWTAAVDVVGQYGAFTCRPHGFRGARAHRISYAIHCRPVSEDEHVLHRCDTPCCVNPDHLFVGDQPANMADKVAKQRQNRGVTHGMVILAEADVRAIRASKERSRVLAKRLAVSEQTICDIRKRRSWRHI